MGSQTLSLNVITPVSTQLKLYRGRSCASLREMPPEQNIPGQLSVEAFAEFKAAYLSEFPDDKISDADLHARAWGVLRVFDILMQPSPGRKGMVPKVADDEVRVLAHLHKSICHQDRSASVREIAEVAGFSSSRSGMRLLDRFIERNWMYRNEEGELEFAEWLKNCEIGFLQCDESDRNNCYETQ
jgi:hypothetical protein